MADDGGRPAEALQAGDLAHRYLWGPAVDQILADERVESLDEAGEVVWPLADPIGTVRDLVLLDEETGIAEVANHRVYDSFGNLQSETNAAIDCLFAFTGRPFDTATGLQNNWNRWYDPELRRWASEDPIGFAGGDGNWYRSAGNVSTGFRDPSGLASGHHYLPQQVIEAAQSLGLLEKGAYYYGLGYCSDQTWPDHKNDTYGGYTHRQYNARIMEEFLDYAKKNKISSKNPMTVAQIEDFMKNRIVNSSDSLISRFNNVIDQQRAAFVARAKRPGALRAPAASVDAAEIIRRGKSFKGTQACLAGRTSGVVLGALMGLLTDTVRAMEVAGRPDGAFRKAVGALTEGDLNDADRWMRGTRADPTRTGFYDELLEVNGAVALNFDKEWTTILQNARNAQEPYLED